MSKYEDVLKEISQQEESMAGDKAAEGRERVRSFEEFDESMRVEKPNKYAQAAQIVGNIAQAGMQVATQVSNYRTGKILSKHSDVQRKWLNQIKTMDADQIKTSDLKKMMQNFEAEIENMRADLSEDLGDNSFHFADIEKAKEAFKESSGKALLAAQNIQIKKIKAHQKSTWELLQESSKMATIDSLETNPDISIGELLKNNADRINSKFPLIEDSEKSTMTKKLTEDTLNTVLAMAEEGDPRRVKDVKNTAKALRLPDVTLSADEKYKTAVKNAKGKLNSLILDPSSPKALTEAISLANSIGTKAAHDKAKLFIEGIENSIGLSGANKANFSHNYARKLKNLGYSDTEAEKIVQNTQKLAARFPYELAEQANRDLTEVSAETRNALGIAPVDTKEALRLRGVILGRFKSGDIASVIGEIQGSAKAFNSKPQDVKDYVSSMLDQIEEDSPDYQSAIALKSYLNHSDLFSQESLTRLAASDVKDLNDRIPTAINTMDTSDFDESFIKYRGQAKEEIMHTAALLAANRLQSMGEVPSDKEGYVTKFEEVYKQELAKISAKQDPESDDGPFFVTRDTYLMARPEEKRNLNNFNAFLSNPEMLHRSSAFSDSTRNHFINSKSHEAIKGNDGMYKLYITTQTDEVHVARNSDGSEFKFNAQMVANGLLPKSLYATPRALGDGLDKANKLVDVKYGDVAGYEDRVTKALNKDFGKDIKASAELLNVDDLNLASAAKESVIRVEDALKGDAPKTRSAVLSRLFPNKQRRKMLEKLVEDNRSNTDTITRKVIDFIFPRQEDELVIGEFTEDVSLMIAARNKHFGPDVLRMILIDNPDKRAEIASALRTARVGDLMSFYTDYFSAEEDHKDGGYELLMNKLRGVPTKKAGVSGVVYGSELPVQSDLREITGLEEAGQLRYSAGQKLTRSQGVSINMANRSGMDYTATSTGLQSTIENSYLGVQIEEILNEVQ